MKNIYFDMDGTIANLYGVNGWLDDILNESVRPYVEAKPLVNMNSLARILNRLVRNGYTVNVISWTAKNGSNEYNEAVAEAKRAWLAKHLGSVKFGGGTEFLDTHRTDGEFLASDEGDEVENVAACHS